MQIEPKPKLSTPLKYIAGKILKNTYAGTNLRYYTFYENLEYLIF